MTLSFARVRAAALMTALLAAVACDSSTAPPALSEEEAADAFDALAAAGLGFDFYAAGAGGTTLAGLRARTVLANAITTIDETAACPNGGTMDVTGEVEETETSVSLDITQDYNNCVSTSSTERVWTFNGSPNIRTLLNVSESAFGGSIKGGIAFSSEGLTGVCTINITINENGISGKVCGRSISESF